VPIAPRFGSPYGQSPSRRDARAGAEDTAMPITNIWLAYLTTFGWAMVGSISMAIGIIISLKLFDLSTPNVDEWDLIKQGNIPIAIIFASLILATAYVIGACLN
jgi:uncharacterized membrane protein YjfL (UPF0719 family)